MNNSLGWAAGRRRKNRYKNMSYPVYRDDLMICLSLDATLWSQDRYNRPLGLPHHQQPCEISRFRSFIWNDMHLAQGLCGKPDSKIHGANMVPTWVLSAPGGPHVGPMNLAIREELNEIRIHLIRIVPKVQHKKEITITQCELVLRVQYPKHAISGLMGGRKYDWS